jgi:uncharacterized membrane protein YeaQ/YmgE (transglycosylase-associated protein family)
MREQASALADYSCSVGKSTGLFFSSLCFAQVIATGRDKSAGAPVNLRTSKEFFSALFQRTHYLTGVDIMNTLAWIVLGLIAGAIAKALFPGHQGGGILGTMILGIVGAFVGGSLFSFLTTGTLALTSAGLSLGGILVAVLGAIVALFIYYAVTRRSASY